jgi:hypothetical protein
MEKSLPILIYLIPAWLAHMVAVSVYMKKFASTHSPQFHLAYFFEVGIIMFTTFGLYYSQTNSPASLVQVVSTVLGFLIIVDALLFGLIKSLRGKFDMGHVGIAYGLVILSILSMSELFKAR